MGIKGHKFVRHRLTHVQVIVLGFALMIAIGTALLMLPCSSADGRSPSLLTALFTATSASCVTGLVRRSTSEWSLFGQVILLLLIQIGGLGFMTIATMFFHLLNRRMGLWQRETMVESINLSRVKGITEFARDIILYTAIIELSGAALLSLRFVPLLGPGRGAWFSLFHSVSAFCNAGFDLMGALPGDGSLTYFATDWLVNMTCILLITVGGLGYVVWAEPEARREIQRTYPVGAGHERHPAVWRSRSVLPVRETLHGAGSNRGRPIDRIPVRLRDRPNGGVQFRVGQRHGQRFETADNFPHVRGRLSGVHRRRRKDDHHGGAAAVLHIQRSRRQKAQRVRPQHCGRHGEKGDAHFLP